MMTAEVQFDADGLVPGIVQDATTGRVLMLGYLNRASLDLTRSTGLVHFWSRSRGELWKKGQTSGNTLEVLSISGDCDGDTLLIQARPAGPTCHTGNASCFDTEADVTAAAGFRWLDDLWAIIAARDSERPEGSYTARLLEGGVDESGRKVTEEATELLIAAKNHTAGEPGERVVEEAADLIYHTLVLLRERSIDARLVVDELESRHRAAAPE